MNHTTDHRRRQVELFSLLTTLDLNGEITQDDFAVAIKLIVTDSAEYRAGICMTLEKAGVIEVHPFSGHVRLNPKKLGQAVDLLVTVRTALRCVAKHSPGVLHG